MASLDVILGGEAYQCVRGSDVERDGMFLELTDALNRAVLEIFYSDQTSAMTLTAFQNAIPLEVVEWAISRAKAGLPPINSN